MRLSAIIVAVLAAHAAASPPAMPPEDCQHWLDDAAEAVRNGYHAVALFRFEKAAACGGPSLVRVATLFGEACQSRNVKKAQLYFTKLPSDDRRSQLVWCVESGMSYAEFAGTGEKAVAACDAFEQAGSERFAAGGPAQALSDFEAANACGPSPKRLKLVVLSACKARFEAKAKKYFARLPESDKQQMAKLCLPPSF